MASVRYIILAACQSAGLYTQFGFESEAAAWIEKQGTNPCAYVYYRQGVGVAGFDNVSVAFGGSNPSAALRRVRDSLERSLEFRSERQTEIGGFPVLAVTARAKKRVYGFGGVASPVPPTPTVDYMYFEAQEANSTVALTSTLPTAPNLEYSTDGVTWQEWQHTTADGTHTFDTLTLTAVGDRVYLRGDNPSGLGTMPEGEEMPLFSHFEMTGKIAAGGNIMSLLDKDAEMTEVPVAGFCLLFGDVTGENPNTALTSAAAMPALTTIGYGGCASMYENCTSLTSAAAMPALTTIGYGGCASMYENCTSMTAAAAMPALTTIGNEGCSVMYSGCTSLTAAAAMHAVTNIGNRGCSVMYSGCTFDMSDDGETLNFAFLATPFTAGETTYSTAYDVAEWMGNTNGFTEPSVDYLYFEAVEANSTISMTSTLPTAPNLEYSTDGVTWQEWQHTTADGAHTFDTLTLTAVGDRVYLRGDNPNGLGNLPEGAEMPLFSHFEMTGKIAAGGNIMSLLDKDMETTEIPAYGFALLFGDTTEENPNTSLTAAAAMPSLTTIGEGGCSFMYDGCTSLTASADMSSLTTISGDGCAFMYSGCTSLTASADMPSLTTIGGDGCRGMYYGCTSLTASADMPSLTTIGEGGCYFMYSGCTSLTASADMPSLTTISGGGCRGMYSGCTSLTSAAAMPVLTSIGEGGCANMYANCTFDMSDDGTTLNFAFPTPPITAGETTYSTAYDVAEWMGNTNGFTNP